ncbi:MAG: hypothetical protein FWF15_04415 [Oscillospiraceae bacterium]|nr:hypothetical protein [Oscillospiraceae bacterium]
MKIVGLTLFQKKNEPGISVAELNLLEGFGIEGDFHWGGEKQVTLLSAETRRWLDSQTEQGLCFKRFKENILIEDLEIKPCDRLIIGNAVLRISNLTKPCFDECPLVSPCRLSGRAVFAVVEKSGTVRIGDTLMRF